MEQLQVYQVILAQIKISISNLAQNISSVVIEIVQKKNLEYNRLHQAIGEHADPKIELFKKGDVQYFSPRSAKQHWTKR